MTNLEKLRETFPKTIFIFRKNGNDETAAIMCSDEWLQGDYDQMYKGSEPCEDVVSREAVMNLYQEYRPSLATHVSEFGDALNSLPPVTPKQKTGHWVKYASPRCGEQHYKCTNCDDYVNFGQYGDYYTKDFKFCPHCGAKMEGEEDG